MSLCSFKNILYSEDPLSSNHPALYSTLPSIAPDQASQPASHLTLPTIPLCPPSHLHMPANQPSLPASPAQLPCQPMQHSRWATWLKQYSTLILHFSTGRQICYVGGLILSRDSTGTKAWVIAADLIDSDGNLHCFVLPLSSCDIKITVVSQCRILVPVPYMNTQLFTFFFSTETCTCWTTQWLGHCWRWLTQTELANWQQTHESGNTNTFWNWLRQQPHSTQVVHYLQTVHWGLLRMRQWWQNRCILSRCLMPTPSAICKKCNHRDFKKLPNQNCMDILMQPETSKALFV